MDVVYSKEVKQQSNPLKGLRFGMLRSIKLFNGRYFMSECKLIPFPLDEYLERKEQEAREALEIDELFHEEVAEKARQSLFFSGTGIPPSPTELWAFSLEMKSRGCK